MEEADLALRNRTYRLIVEFGRVPSLDETAEAMGWMQGEVAAGWRRLHDGHALVLDGVTGEIRMANPFSAVPTAFRVRAAGRWWFGNCAWDAFGILAALRVDGLIETYCHDCGEPISVNVENECPDDTELTFHCLVPARSWWEDITYT